MVLLSKAYRLLAKGLVCFIAHFECTCLKDLTEHFISNMDFPFR